MTLTDRAITITFTVADAAHQYLGDVLLSAVEGNQATLFADTNGDQQTLAGKQAASQCLFEDGGADDPEPWIRD